MLRSQLNTSFPTKWHVSIGVCISFSTHFQHSKFYIFYMHIIFLLNNIFWLLHACFGWELLYIYLLNGSSYGHILYVGRGITGVLRSGCPETFQSSEQFSQEGERGQESQRFRDQHQQIRRYQEGDIIALPAGVAHWCYNDGQEDLVLVAMEHTSNWQNQLDNNPRVCNTIQTIDHTSNYILRIIFPYLRAYKAIELIKWPVREFFLKTIEKFSVTIAPYHLMKTRNGL